MGKLGNAASFLNTHNIQPSQDVGASAYDPAEVAISQATGAADSSGRRNGWTNPLIRSDSSAYWSGETAERHNVSPLTSAVSAAESNYNKALDRYNAAVSGYDTAYDDLSRSIVDQEVSRAKSVLDQAERARNFLTVSRERYEPHYMTSADVGSASQPATTSNAGNPQYAADIANERGRSLTNYLKTYRAEDTNWQGSKFQPETPTPTAADQTMFENQYARDLQNGKNWKDIVASEFLQNGNKDTAYSAWLRENYNIFGEPEEKTSVEQQRENELKELRAEKSLGAGFRQAMQWAGKSAEAGGLGALGGALGTARVAQEASVDSQIAMNFDNATEVAWSLASAYKNQLAEPEYASEEDNRVQALETQLKGYCDALDSSGAMYEQIINNAKKAAEEMLKPDTDLNELYNNFNQVKIEGETNLTKAAQATSELADEVSQKSAQATEEAKALLGDTKLGTVLTDATVNAIQMAIDRAVVSIGGTSIGALGVRSFGSKAQEAEAVGATFEQQVKAAALSSGVEIFTEKFADGLAGAYGKGYADDLVDEIIRKLATSDQGRTALKFLSSGTSEAIEEAFSGAVEPAINSIYKEDALNSYTTPEGRKELLSDVGYSALIGFILGEAGGAVEAGTGGIDESVQKMDQTDAIQQNLQQNGMDEKAARKAAPAVQKALSGEELTKSQTKTINNPIVQSLYKSQIDAVEAMNQRGTKTQPGAQPQVNAEEQAETPAPSPIKPSSREETDSGTSAREPVVADTPAARPAPQPIGPQVQAEAEANVPAPRPAPSPIGTQVTEEATTEVPAQRPTPQPVGTQVQQQETEEVPASRPAPQPVGAQQQTTAPVTEQATQQTEQQAPTAETTQTTEGTTAEAGVPPMPPQAPTNQATDRTYEELGQEYGIIEPGEKPVREANTPKSTAKGTKVTQSVRTTMEAGATPESRLADIQNAVTEGRFSYVPISNRSRATNAEAKVKSKGWSKALKDWTAAVRSGQANADLVAEGAVLVNNAANNPECSGTDYIDLLVDYEMLERAMGQGLQASRILKTLSPEGKLYYITKGLVKMNEDVAKEVAANPKQAEAQAKEQEKKNKTRSEDVTKAVKQAKEKAAKQVFTFEYTDEAAQMIAQAVEAKAKPSKPRAKTLMEELVGTIKRFATERIPSQANNARRMTATGLLTELSTNEEFAREAYELAQQQVRQDTKGTPSQETASQFADAGLDLTNSNIVKRAVAESAVATNENRSTILNQSALGIGENEIANSIANDLIAKTSASEDVANAIREASLDYVQEVLGTETFETAEAATAATNERVENLVRKVMNQIGERFSNLAVSDEYTRQAALQTVQDILTEQYGVNGSSATRIAETIVNNFDTRLNEAIQEELQNRFGEKDASTAIERQLPDRLAEAINLGAFTSEYAEQAINDIFKVDGKYTLDPALIEEYRQQTTDEGRDAVIEKMEQAIADQIPSTLGDKFTALRYLNMLGNLKTQVRNVLGNTGMMAVQKIKNIMRAGVETVASAATGGRIEKQASAFYSPELASAAFNDIRQNKALMAESMGEQKYSSVSTKYSREIEEKRQALKYGDNKLTRGLEKALSSVTGQDVDLVGKQGPIFKLLSLYQAGTTWAMEMGDQVFVTLNYTDALAGYLQAHKITAEQWKSLVTEADADPSSDAAQTVDKARSYAIKQAQEATFRDTNAISEFAQNFDRNWKGAKIVSQGIAPFRKTPANVGVRMEEYSPLGFVNAAVKARQVAKGKGNVTGNDVIDSLSKAVTGTGLAMIGFMLAAAGKARTKSDDDDQEAFDRLRGLQDYSITVNGTNYTLDWAVPAAAALFMGVEGYNLMMDGTVTGNDVLKIIGNLTSPMLQMSMLSGVNDALSNLSNFNDDTDALPQFVLNSAWSYLTQGFTNTLIGQLEQASEDYRQTYYTDKESAIPTSLQKGLAKAGNKTPGVDYQAADYIDAWGRKQENSSNPLVRYGNALLNPSYVSDLGTKSTEVDNELQRLYDYGKDKDRFPSVLPDQTSRSTTVNGTKLTPEEYETYATTKGQESLRLVTDLIESEAYKSLTDDARAEAISECYSFARYLADKEIAEGRGEEYSNDFDELITGVDKSGEAYDKVALNPDNFTAYTAFKFGTKDAVDSQDYEALDKLVSELNKQNKNLKDVLDERNSTLRALSKWKDARLDSETYYTVQKALVESQRRLDKSQKTGSAVELDALANVNLPEATKKRLIDSLPDYGSKTVKGVYDVLYSYGFNSKQINKFWEESQDWVYKETGDPQSSQKAGTLQPLEAAYAIDRLPGLTGEQKSEIYGKLKDIAHNPYKINDWGNWTFSSEKNYLESGRAYQQFGSSGKKTVDGTFGTSSTYNPLSPDFGARRKTVTGQRTSGRGTISIPSRRNYLAP